MSLRRSRRLHVETLEGRITPAVSVRFLSNGLLVIRGDNAPNSLAVLETATPGKFAVSNNGKGIGQFSPSSLIIQMGNSNDKVDLGIKTVLPGNLTVTLGNGADTLTTKLNSVQDARIGGNVLINTGLSSPRNLGVNSYDEVVELYFLKFGGQTTILGAAGSGTSLIDTQNASFGGPTTIVNASTIAVGDFLNADNGTTMSSLVVNNYQKNTDSRQDQPVGPGNGLYVYGGSSILGNLTYGGGAGMDSVFLPSGPANNADVEIGGNVYASLGDGINTLQLGNVDNGAQVGGNVTYFGGSGVDRLLFDSGSVVAGSMYVSLGEGDNQLFGDSIGLGQSMSKFNPFGSASLFGDMTIVLGNGNNFIGSYSNLDPSSLFVAGNLSITVGNGDNLGGDAFAPGAIDLFNVDLTLGGTATYRAGTGTNNLLITNEQISNLRLLFSGGPTTLTFDQASGVFNGNLFIDFGTGFGPKEINGTAGFGGNVTILNY